ncbi:hypothetical protein SNEBB_009389 [Seison nebaliae]|nr:hypothetical protein SNEBB_009389 [Seison nebaliae]
MSYFADDYLPSPDELDVPFINVTSGVLRAAAPYLGKYCDKQCKEFMLCRREEKEARKCLKENKIVSQCSLKFFQLLKNSECADVFEDHWRCVDDSYYGWQEPSRCPRTRKIFDNCMKEKLGMERPELGHFSLTRLHESSRKMPVEKSRTFPERNAVPTLDQQDSYPEAKITSKMGNRLF